MFESAFADGGSGLQLTAIPDSLPLQGGVPLEFGGHVVGAIGTSGMSGEQEEQMAKSGAAALQS